AMFQSLDGGNQWRRLPGAEGASYFGAIPLSDQTAILFGMRGHLARLDLKHGAWRPLRSGVEETLLGGTRTAGGEILLVGAGGRLLVSREGGEAFDKRALPLQTTVSSIVSTSDGGLLLLGEAGASKLAPNEVRSLLDKNR